MIDHHYPFKVEGYSGGDQHYHGPRERMRKFLREFDQEKKEELSQEEVIEYLTKNYPQHIKSIEKIKFYRYTDNRTSEILRFFIVWTYCDLEAREELFDCGRGFTLATGWYPMVTGLKILHHHRPMVDFLEDNLRKAMNKSNIESLPALGEFRGIVRMSRGEGTSIIIQTSVYDIVLDAGISPEDLDLGKLRPGVRKWLFISHSHKDHTGGVVSFLLDRDFVISCSVVTLEILLNAMADSFNAERQLPKHFFYRFAPMWYRSKYTFQDRSSIEVLPTYHFPGSMGFLFTFADGKKVFYSGDLNLSASYMAKRLYGNAQSKFYFDPGVNFIDHAILDGALIGRKIGTPSDDAEQILTRVESSLKVGRNHIILAPPGDYGLFIFLHLYDMVVAKGPERLESRIFLDGKIIDQLAILDWQCKRKRSGSLDDAIIDFFNSRSSLAETVRMFDIRENLEWNIEQLNRRGIRGVFILDDARVSNNDYISSSAWSNIVKVDYDITRIGKAATRPVQSDRISEDRVASIDGALWQLHSTDDTIKSYLLSGYPHFGHVYLFHNFPGRLDKFICRLNAEGFGGEIEPI